MNKPTAKSCALLFAVVGLVACGDQFSTQEAYVTCQEIADRTLTSSEASFADCVDCHERCGTECDRQNAPPPDEYVCPEDLDQ